MQGSAFQPSDFMAEKQIEHHKYNTERLTDCRYPVITIVLEQCDHPLLIVCTLKSKRGTYIGEWGIVRSTKGGVRET